VSPIETEAYLADTRKGKVGDDNVVIMQSGAPGKVEKQCVWSLEASQFDPEKKCQASSEKSVSGGPQSVIFMLAAFPVSTQASALVL
jgi:hypothetical protein